MDQKSAESNITDSVIMQSEDNFVYKNVDTVCQSTNHYPDAATVSGPRVQSIFE